ncbi:arylsulfatase [Algoriphagus namhaensis]|uniref:Arylsulfatase n=1 Tax=Algoriphagus namhaensis TaxID=915353 RepID=A0ABV8ARZ6_9BACT
MSRFLLVLLVISLVSCQKEITKSPPNVILILTDDQGYGDLGIHGNKAIQTPVLDQLANESARFERFYVSPLCAPTRASMLTGRYHLRTGTVSVSKGLETMDAEEYTLAELFKDNGYSTAIFGKWHNGQHYPNHPLAQGFDVFTGFLGGHWSNYFDTHLEKDREMQKIEGYISDVLTDEAINFLEENKDRSFFTYLAYNTPHSPHQVPDEYFDRYKAQGLDDELAAIYGMVTNLDDNIGRLLQKVKELGLEENTVIIFLTDNGPNGIRFNDEMKGRKGSVHEGGVRVPSFWKWPGKIPPGVQTTPASHIDILPTLVELLGLEFEEKRPLDGVSLAMSLRGEDQDFSRSIFSHVAQPERKLDPFPGAIRKDSLVLTHLEAGDELYDLKNDPSQKSNLADTYPELTMALSEEYKAWFEEVTEGANFDRPIPISSQSNEILLASYESLFSGELSFYEGHGWAQDWLTQWKDLDDRITWSLDVLDPGTFEVIFEYATPEDQIGSQLVLQQGMSQISFEITEPFIGETISSPDRITRKEAPEKTWKKIAIGEISLEKGKTDLTLFAKKIPADEVGDLYSLRLIPVNK